MQGSINLSEDELRALLYLPFFRAPNQLSPFFKQQSQEAWANCEPQEGLSLLEQKGLWDSAQKELTLEGRKRFVPLFSPTARVMLFSGAYSRVPFEEYYSFKKYTVQYSDYSGLTVSSPMDEQQLVDHLRKIFSDRHPPITENRLSLFEEEFILLLLTVSLQEEGISVDIQSLFQRIRESIEAKGLAFPILGWVGTEGQIPPMLAMESLKKTLNVLLRDGLLEQGPDGTLRPTSAIGTLFGKVHNAEEHYLIREEFDGEKLLAREVSIFKGNPGYFLGRCSYHSQYNTRIVHLEDMEWYTLFRLINEIARPKDYLPKLTLEVSMRYCAHLRG